MIYLFVDGSPTTAVGSWSHRIWRSSSELHKIQLFQVREIGQDSIALHGSGMAIRGGPLSADPSQNQPVE
jgi:hypothetical protein